MPETTGEALVAHGLRKAYGATVALEHADLCLRPGAVRALLGENGAGKSTLVRILTGALQDYVGHMSLHGTPYAPDGLLAARTRGIATAFQELSLVPNLSVAHNLLLPRLPRGTGGLVSLRQVVRAGTHILARHQLEGIDPQARVEDLTLAQRQRIEIVRALENANAVLILDEPTAALSETDWLFARIEDAQTRGVAVLYISHRLAEVRAICSEATVLRNGRSMATVCLAQASDADIFAMMVGRRMAVARTPRARTHTTPRPRLAVRQLGGQGLRNISFSVHHGEVLGLAALEGQGQRALFRMLAGLQKPASGTVTLDGSAYAPANPRAALRAGSGIAYLPEERKTEGILAGQTAATNVVLPILPNIARATWIDAQCELKAAQPAADKVEMHARYLGFEMANLSGGNQQKALVARSLATGAQTLLLFDPTRGVDVGTKQSIYAAIRAFADAGGSVLFYSSELSEIVQLADRALVLYGGHLVQDFAAEDLAEPRLVAAMLGHGKHAQGERT